MVKWEEVAAIDVPKGVTIKIDGNIYKVKGKLGNAERDLRDNYVKVTQEGNQLKVLMSKKNKRNWGIAGTWTSELKGIMKGVVEGFTYEMKIDYTHFPTRVSVKGDNVVIENFLGERSPRLAKIIGDTKVNVKGDRLTISGIDKRDIGETSANIERSTKIKGFDPRIFQDGIYIIEGGS